MENNDLFYNYENKILPPEPIHPKFYEVTIEGETYKCLYEYMVLSIKEGRHNLIVFDDKIVFMNDKDFKFARMNKKKLFK